MEADGHLLCLKAPLDIAPQRWAAEHFSKRPLPVMWNALRTHWLAYLGEAAGLAFFMVNAAWITTALEYPHSRVRRLFDPLDDSPGGMLARRIPLGLAMAAVVAVIVYNPWGRRSGAHVNPAVTAAFWRLGKISTADAAWYILFQFAGGLAAALTMAAVLGAPFRDPHVNMATTMPGPSGAAVAFAAEFGMTFAVMGTMLFCLSRRRLEGRAGCAVAALIMAFLWVETPLSGMSLNPARTFGSAFAASRWTGLWIYFTAPVLASLAAAELFARLGLVERMQMSGLSTRRAGADGVIGTVAVGDKSVPHFPAEIPAS